MEAQMEDTPIAHATNKTLLYWIEKYLEQLRHRLYSKRTLEGVTGRLKNFACWMSQNVGVTTLDFLQAEHLRKWNNHILGIVNQKGLPCNPSSIYNHMMTVRVWLRYLIEQALIHPGLGNVIQMIRLPDHLSNSVLTHAQARKLLSSIRTDSPVGYCCRAIIEIMYSSGLRAGEIRALKLSDVNYDQKTLLVTGKRNKQRIVPVGRTAMRHLETYIKAIRPFYAGAGKDNNALFLSLKGYPLKRSTLSQWIHDTVASIKTDVHVTAHTFRRSCATELIRNGANMYHVKELLGHEDLDSMKHYVRLTIMDLKKTHEKCHPREKDE